MKRWTCIVALMLGATFPLTPAPAQDGREFDAALHGTDPKSGGPLLNLDGEVIEEIAESLGLKDSRGVLVNQVNEASPAEQAGIRHGDVLLSFDGENLNDGGPAEFVAALNESAGSVLLRIAENGYSRYVTLRWR